MKEKPMASPSHMAFADEKGYNLGRYRAISLVSLEASHAATYRQALKSLLEESQVREFKWEKLGSARERFAAMKLVAFVIEQACSRGMRVDTLMWDIEDSRHRISGRDDIGNLGRMYYHLLKNVLCNRWPDGASWVFCPDENSALRWQTMHDCLTAVSTKTETTRDLFTQGKFQVRLKREFRIETINPCKSHEEPLVQLGDLFAGLAVYSRISYDRFECWKRSNSAQKALFDSRVYGSAMLSKADKERCFVLDVLDAGCKARRLGVSLKTARGLKTFDDSKPINFWWYAPQHDADRAPRKERGKISHKNRGEKCQI